MSDARKVVTALRLAGTNAVKQIQMNLLPGLQSRTPVATGFAQANWVPSVGAPFAGTAGTRQAAEMGSLDTSTAPAGLAQVLVARDLTRTNTYITNNVHYIVDLNEGSSAKGTIGVRADGD